LTKIDNDFIILLSKMDKEFTHAFFDASSEAWLKNKIRKGPSMAYICSAFTRDGKQCKKASYMKSPLSDHLCKQHINKMVKDE